MGETKRKMQHYTTANIAWPTSMTVKTGKPVGSNGKDPKEQLKAINLPAYYELHH